MVKLAIMRDCGEVPSAQCPGNPLPPLRNDPGRVQSCAGAPAPGGIARAPPEQINPLPPLSEPAVAASNDEDTTCKSYQFFGARIRCAARFVGELQERISSVRATRRSWSLNAWKKQVKSIAAERSWGVCKHGGSRKARPKVQKVVSSNLPATGGNIIRLRVSRKMSQQEYTRVCTRHASHSGRPSRATPALTQHAHTPAASSEASHGRQHFHSSARSGPNVVVAGEADAAPAVSCSRALAPGGEHHSSAASASAIPGGPGGPGFELKPGVDLGYRVLGPVLGAGTFGEVFPALWKNGNTEAGGQLVVVKHVAIEKPHEDISDREAKEVQICRQLQHPNVVRLLHAVQTPFALDLIFEHCDFDLRMVLKRSLKIGEGIPIIKQLCCGLEYIHDLKILHRDLKPANILLQDQRGHGHIVKIADFGCSRPLAASMTKKVTTLWYRAPELLLATARYGTAVDMWSLGCIVVEILAGKVAFPGTSEFDMLLRIFRVFGTPSNTLWFSLARLPSFSATRFTPSKGGAPTAWQLNDVERNFVQELLTPCPLQRKTAKDASGHVCLKSPMPPASGGDSMPAAGGRTALPPAGSNSMSATGGNKTP